MKTLTTKTTLFAAALTLGLGMGTPCSAMQQPDLQTLEAQLRNAAVNGDLPTVQALLAAGADVNAPGNYGWTALNLAANRGHTATVQALLAIRGINVNAKTRFNCTALHWAAAAGNTKIAQLLIAHGATLPDASPYYEWYLEQRAQVFVKLSTHQ